MGYKRRIHDPAVRLGAGLVIPGASLGPELCVNGGFEGTYNEEAATLLVAPNWESSNCETDGTDVLGESLTVHSGAKSQKIDVDAADEGIIMQTGWGLEVGRTYRFSIYVYGVSGSGRLIDNLASTISENFTPPVGTWTRYFWDKVVANANAKLNIRSYNAAAHFLVDDMSIKLVA